jgi:hypothetical protein
MRISKAGILQYADSAGQVLLKIFAMEVKKGIPKDCKYIAELALKNNKNETIELKWDNIIIFLHFPQLLSKNM